MADLELNYEGFFTEGKKQPDLQTIVLHEFGHLLGLQHSCEVNPKKPGVPNCTADDVNPDYLSALMYPQFSFFDDGTGEQKQSLFTNDQGRGNCLYGQSSSTLGGG